jgi:hypothetical protein
MRVDQVQNFLNDMTSTMRNLKLSSLLGNSLINTETPKKPFWSFLKSRSYERVRELNEMGGIITGSRALKYYKINGVPLLKRKAKDWDIILNRSAFFKFCSDNSLSKLMYEKGFIQVDFNSGIFLGTDSYNSERWLLRKDFDIISKDETDDIYIEIDGYKISTLESIINEKMSFIQNDLGGWIKSANYEDTTNGKHLSDCVEIMVKLTALKQSIDVNGTLKDCISQSLYHSDLSNTFSTLKDVIQIIES